jgi:hypothetical protein
MLYFVKQNKFGTFWYRDAERKLLHRENGPAVEHVNGDKLWYIDGNLHREDGPAIKSLSGAEQWYIDGKLHCETGPAIVYASGVRLWFLDGIELSGPEELELRLKERAKSCADKVIEIDGKKYKLVPL